MNDKLLEKLLIASEALSLTERQVLALRLQRMSDAVPGFAHLPTGSPSKPEPAAPASGAGDGGE